MKANKSLKALFDLIKSLRKEEKRQFKLYSQRVGEGDKKYLQLYRTIERWKNYKDGKSLEEKLKIKGLGHLHVRVPYLNDLIVQSLRLQYENRFVDGQINSLMAEAHLMKLKGLIGRQQHVLTKAKVKAEKYERFDLLLRILDRQIVYAINHGDEKVEENVQKLYEEMALARAKQDLNEKYRRLFFDVYMYQRIGQRMHDTEAYQTLKHIRINHLEGVDEAVLITFRSKIDYHFSWALIHSHLEKDFLAASHSYKRVFEIWQAHPHHVEDDYATYMIHSINYLSTCLILKDYEPIPTILDEIKSIKPLSTYDELRQFENITYLELSYLMLVVKFAEAIKLEQQVKDGLKKFGDRVSKSKLIAFHCNMAVLHFALANYNECFKWATDIRDKKIDKPEQIQFLIHLLLLLAVFEREGGTEFLKFQLNLFSRQKYNNKALLSFKEFIISFFQDLMKVPIREQRSVLEMAFKKLNKDEYQTKWKNIQWKENLSIWLETHVSGKDFITVQKERSSSK